MGGAGRYSLRAATPPTGGVNAPNDVKHGKAGTEAKPVGEAFLGGCPGDYEAFVPSKNVWSLLVAAWKSTFLLPAVTSFPR
jgi:hypothetical protein